VSYLLFWPLMQVGWNALIGHDRVGPVALVAVLSVGANLGISLLLVTRFGLAGVIVGTVLSNAAAVVAYLRIQLRAFDLRWATFVRAVVLPNLAVLCSAALAVLGLLQLHAPGSLLVTGLYLATGVGTGLAVFWLVGLDSGERAAITASVLPGRPDLEAAEAAAEQR
jgi:O-antigen/teichoic acid export membrane protein